MCVCVYHVQDSYTKVLSEDAEDGHSVITVYVVDRDSRSGGGGQLVFRILGDDTGAFTHEATARDDGLWSVTVRTVGEVSIGHSAVDISENIIIPTPQSFDYESGRRLYDLKLEARDGVTPVMVVTANLTVTIVDVNDESPVFSPSSYVLSVSHVTCIGSHVTCIESHVTCVGSHVTCMGSNMTY